MGRQLSGRKLSDGIKSISCGLLLVEAVHWILSGAVRGGAQGVCCAPRRLVSLANCCAKARLAAERSGGTRFVPFDGKRSCQRWSTLASSCLNWPSAGRSGWRKHGGELNFPQHDGRAFHQARPPPPELLLRSPDLRPIWHTNQGKNKAALARPGETMQLSTGERMQIVCSRSGAGNKGNELEWLARSRAKRASLMQRPSFGEKRRLWLCARQNRTSQQ